MNFLKIISHMLARNTALFIIAVATVTYFFPSLCTWVKGTNQIIILGLIMLSMGMTLSINDYKNLLSRPLDMLIGTCAQFLIMPFIAITLAKLFNLSDGLTLGLVLVGCCPGGVASNIMSYLCKGDVAFSVGMTTCSTLIAPVATPLLVNALVGEKIDLDLLSMFNFMLIVTIIPVAIGSFLNIIFHKHQVFSDIREIMPGVAVICFACIVGGVMAVHGQKFIESGFLDFLFVYLHIILLVIF